jgi:hypothetical protein
MTVLGEDPGSGQEGLGQRLPSGSREEASFDQVLKDGSDFS